MKKKLLTLEEMMQYLNIGRVTLWRYMREKGMPYYQLPGGDLRFDVDEVRAWMRKKPVDRSQQKVKN
jgi:excisionase family DNA binding protein